MRLACGPVPGVEGLDAFPRELEYVLVGHFPFSFDRGEPYAGEGLWWRLACDADRDWGQLCGREMDLSSVAGIASGGGGKTTGRLRAGWSSPAAW